MDKDNCCEIKQTTLIEYDSDYLFKCDDDWCILPKNDLSKLFAEKFFAEINFDAANVAQVEYWMMLYEFVNKMYFSYRGPEKVFKISCDDAMSYSTRRLFENLNVLSSLYHELIKNFKNISFEPCMVKSSPCANDGPSQLMCNIKDVKFDNFFKCYTNESSFDMRRIRFTTSVQYDNYVAYGFADYYSDYDDYDCYCPYCIGDYNSDSSDDYWPYG